MAAVVVVDGLVSVLVIMLLFCSSKALSSFSGSGEVAGGEAISAGRNLAAREYGKEEGRKERPLWPLLLLLIDL